MKNFLLAFSIASIFASCSTEAKKDLAVKTEMAPVNTAGYALSNGSTDVGSYNKQEEYAAPSTQKVVTRTIIKKVYVQPEKQKDYTPQPTTTGNAPVTVPETAPSTIPSTAGVPSVDGNGKTASTGAETSTKKKGWSDAAKGAAIGGVAGAIGGAVINGKNRGVGAVIGAVVGAAGGYAIGRARDKKKAANDYSMVVN